ncbi:MAG: hypothetical protein J7502_01445 [Flavisolibacter sp.]|nr:hypothetical protein [Flavisolibacter sp.]
MSERIHVLAQQLFGKSSVDECALQEVKNLASRYPYFAPAQFLLLEKLRKENSPEYTAQLQKAVLYYHNPLEFEYFIAPERFETEIDFEESIPSTVISHDGEVTSLDATTPSEEIRKPVIDEVVVVEPKPVNIEPEQTGISSEEMIPLEEIDLPNPEVTISSEEEVMSAEAENKMTENIERVLDQEEEQMKEPAPASANDLVFEPYHTVDYFASQGVKLSQEETGKDKFGKQLKSFTDWLKTMKRLPSKEISQTLDSASESKVQHLAADSVHDSDIVTEAMAEVWIKQGNREKAIETYNKLGLLNPSKKAYFAGLIENLKRS